MLCCAVLLLGWTVSGQCSVLCCAVLWLHCAAVVCCAVLWLLLRLQAVSLLLAHYRSARGWGQWCSCCSLPHSTGQGAVRLLQHTAILQTDSGQWNSCCTSRHLVAHCVRYLPTIMVQAECSERRFVQVCMMRLLYSDCPETASGGWWGVQSHVWSQQWGPFSTPPLFRR